MILLWGWVPLSKPGHAENSWKTAISFSGVRLSSLLFYCKSQHMHKKKKEPYLSLGPLGRNVIIETETSQDTQHKSIHMQHTKYQSRNTFLGLSSDLKALEFNCSHFISLKYTCGSVPRFAHLQHILVFLSLRLSSGSFKCEKGENSKLWSHFWM